MGLYFEAKLREAEQTINTLISESERKGGGVYVCDRDDASSGFNCKLTKPISIIYWMPIEQRENE